MQKSQLKNLVQYSYNNGRLDESAVETIADKLERKELKAYLRLLKQEQQKKEVIVIAAQELTNEEKQKLESLYPEKRVVYSIDASMISGVKVIENDQEFEINMNSTFHDIMSFLNNYDR